MVDGKSARGRARPTSRLMQVMVANELDRLATISDDSTGRRLRVLMRMVDYTASPAADLVAVDDDRAGHCSWLSTATPIRLPRPRRCS